MKLEEALKRGNFSSELEKVFVNVLFTANTLYYEEVKRLKPYRISPEQYHVLRILRDSHPSKINLLDVSCRMLDRNSNATRLVEKLRLKGLVDRKPAKKDRRQVEICITKEGLNLLKSLDRDSLIWGKHYRGLEENEAEILNELLEKMW